MKRFLQFLAALLASASLVAVDVPAFAQGKGKDKDRSEQKGGGEGKGGGAQKPKKQHHNNGKSMLGDKIKQNGHHAFDKHGKFTAAANVENGKITGVDVKHDEKGAVAVKKYKTKQKMASAAGIQPVSLQLAQSGDYIGTTYIGYSYIDDYGEEVIYWFPYDMIQDPWTGAIDYVPVA